MPVQHDFDRAPMSVAEVLRADDSRSVYLVGIDDTDNLYSRGTGSHARRLGALLQSERVATLLDITRHQLLFDRRIPYTSHNSSLCLRMLVAEDQRARLIQTCQAYLLAESAEGSDAGLCLAAWSKVTPAVEAFGASAKRDILTIGMARNLGAAESLFLEGLTGNHGGIIGALAAIGLRRGGKDGRVAWRPGIRETTGIITAGELVATTGIDAVRRLDDGTTVAATDRIDVRPWPRAVLIDGQAVLLVQKAGSYHDHFDWQLAAKSILQAY